MSKIKQNAERKRFGATTVAAFIAWGAAMFVLGAVSPDLGITASNAADSPNLVRLDRHRLEGNDLGEYEPYEPDAGNLMARGHDYYYSGDEQFGLGVWESKPGEMTYVDLEYDELMVILDGSLVMTDTSGHAETFTVGEGVLLPQGWNGTLGVPEGGVRKIWVTYMGGKK